MACGLWGLQVETEQELSCSLLLRERGALRGVCSSQQKTALGPRPHGMMSRYLDSIGPYWCCTQGFCEQMLIDCVLDVGTCLFS